MNIRTTGRAERQLEIETLGPLSESDLALLSEEKGSRAPALKRLSDRHHALARNIASGMEMWEAAAITGYDISRVSILKDDPAFKELIEFYRKDIDAQYVQLHSVLAGMSLDAANILRDRMEDTPEKIKTETLLEIMTKGADRTGHGPSSTTKVDVHVGMADRLEEARKRVAARRALESTPVIDAGPIVEIE